MKMIAFLLTKLFEILIGFGNWGLFVSAIGIFPTEIIMAVLASQEGSSLFIISLVSALGETVGAFPLYIIGKILTGDKIYNWLKGKGKFLKIDKESFDKNKRMLLKKSYLYLFFTRFIPYLRIAASLAAGVLEMNFIIFSLVTFAGSWVYSFLITYLGRLVGGDLKAIMKYTNLFDKWILVILFIYLSYKILYKNREKIQKWVKKIKEEFANKKK